MSVTIDVFDEEEEYYALFVRISGPRGTLLLFYDEDTGPPMELAAELAEVLKEKT